MIAPKRLTLAQMRTIRRQLKEAERDLLTYLDPADDNCAVPAAARTASAEYLASWTLGPIQNALSTLDLFLSIDEGE